MNPLRTCQGDGRHGAQVGGRSWRRWPGAASLVPLCLLVLASPFAGAQAPYIGFVYPAGGQQGTTFRATLGGQNVDGVDQVYVSGAGVTARVIEYNKRLNPQQLQVIREQLKEIKDEARKAGGTKHSNLVDRIERSINEYVDQPACAAIVNRLVLDITIASNAAPGEREIRVSTSKGPSNPLVFMVGELPEYAGEEVPPSKLITLGKEEQSLRRKTRAKSGEDSSDTMMMAMMSAMGASAVPGDLDDPVARIKLPCTVNGQITSGTVDRYRFRAKKGQQLVINVQARTLVPYMADAVPGWFQPVVALWDARGREVAYNDDYRFKPDPVLMCDVPEDGEYMFAIYDSIYRGREDFVYRITIGEFPFITSIFPLGGPAGAPPPVAVKGVNLAEASVAPLPKHAAPGIHPITAHDKAGRQSNVAPFALDTLPEAVEKESNDSTRDAQALKLPVIVNGRIDRPGDRDVFRVEGRAGDQVVAEVTARRLDSPLDSVLKLTDASGRCIAINDDREDLASGLNTHHADSYIMATLPADGVYYVDLGDTQHKGGTEYGYRLRVSAPRPDFALRVVPSAMLIRSNSPAYPAVHVIRNDGFTGPIKVTLEDPPPGFAMYPATFTGTQTMIRVTVRANLTQTDRPVSLRIVGTATNGAETVVREAVAAEDRMQAFLWRHLVPAHELVASVAESLPSPPPRSPSKQQPAKKNAAADSPAKSANIATAKPAKPKN